MRKTQTIAKTSFKGIVDLQSEKLPQKKSRSRSIRDRNNTTSNQFSVSRTTEYERSETAQNQSRKRQATWAQGNNHTQNNANKLSQKNNTTLKQPEQELVKFEDNLSSNMSNKSRNENSIEKIRSNMRKESQELKQKVRERSNSRRRKYSGANSNNSRSKQNSRESHANKFPNPVGKPQYLNKNAPLNEEQFSAEELQQKQALNHIINLKNHLNSLQHNYSSFAKQLKLSGNKQNQQFNLLDVTSGENLVQKHMSQLKEKAEDLNNIVETFHINFKENLSRTNHQISEKVQKYLSSGTSKHSQESNNGIQDNRDANSAQIQTIIDRLEKQFSIGKNFNSENLGKKKSNPISTSKTSFFTQIQQNSQVCYSDLEKKLLLAEQRLLK